VSLINIPEHYSAVVAASKNKMNLALSIAVGSAIQIATLLFPIMVFAGISIGVPIYVGQIETYIIVGSCFFSAYPLITGTSSYVIGYCFIVFYIFYVVGYYFREESSAIAGEQS